MRRNLIQITQKANSLVSGTIQAWILENYAVRDIYEWPAGAVGGVFKCYKIGMSTLRVKYQDDRCTVQGDTYLVSHIEYADPELFDKLAMYIKNIV